MSAGQMHEIRLCWGFSSMKISLSYKGKYHCRLVLFLLSSQNIFTWTCQKHGFHFDNDVLVFLIVQVSNKGLMNQGYKRQFGSLGRLEV